MLLYSETTIEVSHQVASPIAQQNTIHGHSYWIRVFVKTSVEFPTPVEKLQEDVNTIGKMLDHTHLNNEVPEGTMESIARWFEKKIKDKQYDLKKIIVERKSMGIGVEYILG